MTNGVAVSLNQVSIYWCGYSGFYTNCSDKTNTPHALSSRSNTEKRAISLDQLSKQGNHDLTKQTPHSLEICDATFSSPNRWLYSLTHRKHGFIYCANKHSPVACQHVRILCLVWENCLHDQSHRSFWIWTRFSDFGALVCLPISGDSHSAN